MNGRTDVDATLNPHTAAADRATWGWPWLNASWYGDRLICVVLGRLKLDLYWAGWRRVFTSRGGGANGSARYAQLYTPFGAVTWITHRESPEFRQHMSALRKIVAEMRELRAVRQKEVRSAEKPHR